MVIQTKENICQKKILLLDKHNIFVINKDLNLSLINFKFQSIISIFVLKIIWQKTNMKFLSFFNIILEPTI